MLSRVADNLYWMARHLERAEHAARLLDVNLTLMLDQGPLATDARWDRLLVSLDLDPADVDGKDAYAVTRAVGFDAKNPSGVAACVAAARENARQVRQQISGEMFEQVNAVFWNVRRTGLDEIWNLQPSEFFRAVRQGCHLFEGLTDSTMEHGEEWYFIQLGRFLERAASTTRLLNAHFSEDPASGLASGLGFEAGEYLKWVGLLKSCTAFEPYLKAYHAEVKPPQIAEFLLLNNRFPKSVRFAAEKMFDALQHISELAGTRRGDRVERLAGRLQAALEYGQIDEIMGGPSGGISHYLVQVERQCNEISNSIYRTYISYPIEEVAA